MLSSSLSIVLLVSLLNPSFGMDGFPMGNFRIVERKREPPAQHPSTVPPEPTPTSSAPPTFFEPSTVGTMSVSPSVNPTEASASSTSPVDSKSIDQTPPIAIESVKKAPLKHAWWTDDLSRYGNWSVNPPSQQALNKEMVKVTLITTGIRNPSMTSQVPTAELQEKFTIPKVTVNCTTLEPKMRAPLIGGEVSPLQRDGYHCVEIYNSLNCSGLHYKGGSFKNHFPNFHTVYDYGSNQWIVMPFFHVGSIKACKAP